ncbi:MAG TPA: UV DNA damage repair endonuclease UvsE [Acidobacteriaceae bacterium]|jgi:UV DNA damage endonuclease|nr:UV DNA damage repair endonuclease UvsE [Acidobacteriaceae bacterium]
MKRASANPSAANPSAPNPSPATSPAKKKAAKKSANKKAPRVTAKQIAASELERMHATPLSPCDALEGQPSLRAPQDAMRLGFPVKVMGQPGLKSNDTRRWQGSPHLRVSLGFLCDIFAYLRKHRIHMYRMSSDLAPYATHPDMPQFHTMVRDSASDLARIGRLAREADIRLSFHPSQFIVLNSENETLTRKSMWDLDSQAEMLDLMECGPEAVLVVHVGGAYGDRESGWRRWAQTWKRLSEPVRRRLVLENDDIRYSAADVLKVHEATGVKCVWDYQHHWCFNPEGLDLVDTLRRFCATWPSSGPQKARPKMHFSCARTEMREFKRKNRHTGKKEVVLQPPVWTGHADYNNPFETITFLRSIQDIAVDIMLESKAKDLSLIRLRNDIARFAPELAPRYGIDAVQAAEDVTDIIEAEPTTEALA